MLIKHAAEPQSVMGRWLYVFHRVEAPNKRNKTLVILK